MRVALRQAHVFLLAYPFLICLQHMPTYEMHAKKNNVDGLEILIGPDRAGI